MKVAQVTQVARLEECVVQTDCVIVTLTTCFGQSKYKFVSAGIWKSLDVYGAMCEHMSLKVAGAAFPTLGPISKAAAPRHPVARSDPVGEVTLLSGLRSSVHPLIHCTRSGLVLSGVSEVHVYRAYVVGACVLTSFAAYIWRIG